MPSTCAAAEAIAGAANDTAPAIRAMEAARRALRRIGFLSTVPSLDGAPGPLRILDKAAARKTRGSDGRAVAPKTIAAVIGCFQLLGVRARPVSAGLHIVSTH